jgi:hypothetical protein
MWVLHIANINTSTGSYKENNRPLLYKHPRKGTHTRSGQLDDTPVTCKKDFINIHFKDKKCKQNFNEF